MGRLRGSWAELPLEKKLGTVFVPILVAAIGVGVPLLLAGGGNGGEEKADPQPQLETIDLAVTGGSQLSDPPKVQEVDLTVRNSGDLLSIVKRVGFRIRASAPVKVCTGGGAGLEPTERYKPVLLPSKPSPDQIVKTKVSAPIEPGDARRFTVGLSVPDRAKAEGKRIYQLDVLLYHDQGEEPLRAGTALAAVPYVPVRWDFWSGQPIPRATLMSMVDGPEIVRCLDRNEANLRKMLALSGERSAGLSLGVLNEPS